MPRFKWAQQKDKIFLSIMVRDLAKDSVSVELTTAEGEITSDTLLYRAKNKAGDEFSLDLPLREDVLAKMHWEHLQRPDKWGDPVLITMDKANKHRWDVLVQNPKKFKGFLDKDYTREDPNLEPEEEIPYVEDNKKVLTALTEKNLDKTIGKYTAVITNVRFPWCTSFKSQDEAFVKAAKAAKKRSKKEPKWKNVAFAVIDAREERKLARRFGASCEGYSPKYQVFTGVGEDPVTIDGKYNEDDVLKEAVKFTSPAIQVIKSAADLEPFKENTTITGFFASEASAEYKPFKKAANTLRGEMVFAAQFGSAAQVELFPKGQKTPYKYELTAQKGSDDEFLAWIRPRALPLLQQYDWKLRDEYEKLNLPIAKVWINDDDKNGAALDKTVRHAVKRVAKNFVGRLAFVENKKSTYSYELRDFGLNAPETYPAFGIASNNSYNALKFAFETPPEFSTAEEFWKNADKVVDRVSAFCEDYLAGKVPQAHESGIPTAHEKGQVKQIVWKTVNELKEPSTDVLLEVYGKYRQDDAVRKKEVEHLATVLKDHADTLTIAKYDTSDNYVDPDMFAGRGKYVSDTHWWFFKKGATTGTQLTKPKKKDAAIKDVLKFAQKESGLSFDPEESFKKFEELMTSDPPPKPPEPPKMPDMGGKGGMGGMMGGMGGMGGDMPDMGDLGGMAGLGGMGGMAGDTGGGEL